MGKYLFSTIDVSMWQKLLWSNSSPSLPSDLFLSDGAYVISKLGRGRACLVQNLPTSPLDI